MEQERQTPSPFYERPTNSEPVNFQKKTEEPANGLATAAMVLGIISIVMFFTFTIYPTIILGSLAIILALLSRGNSLKMHSSAKTGIITSIVAISCNILLIAATCFLIFGSPDFFESIYGMSYQEMMEGIQDGTLDYEELYENIYDNMYEDTNDTLHEDM